MIEEQPKNSAALLDHHNENEPPNRLTEEESLNCQPTWHF